MSLCLAPPQSSARLGAAPHRRQAATRLPPFAPRAYQSGGEAAAAPPAGQEAPKVLSSYDDGGYEAAAPLPVDMDALAEEERAREPDQASYGATACPLPPACPMPGELERQLAQERQDLLESLDGMVGNYEFAAQEGEQQPAADDDLQSILAEIEALKAKAAGGNGPGSAEAGEGAGVSDLE